MTKEQAINYLYSSGMSEEQVKTVVEALEQEPCEDAISRQAVLSYIYNDLGLGDEENGADIERQMELESSYRYVKSLPPVKPQEPYKGMTNGEVIKAMFGNDKVSEFMGYARIMARVGNWFNDGVVAEFDKDWWNSPYEPQESEE